jgi:hypothetical protein
MRPRRDNIVARSIMVPGLKKIDCFVGDAVHEPVFLSDTA